MTGSALTVIVSYQTHDTRLDFTLSFPLLENVLVLTLGKHLSLDTLYTATIQVFKPFITHTIPMHSLSWED